MKITWKFADDTVSTVEVDEKVGTLILDSRREEENAERKHCRHCWSLDAITYEGGEYGAEDAYDFGEADLMDKHVREVFSRLSDDQRRRLLMLAGGMSIRDIAKKENVAFNAAYESVEAAKKKFSKYF